MFILLNLFEIALVRLNQSELTKISMADYDFPFLISFVSFRIDEYLFNFRGCLLCTYALIIIFTWHVYCKYSRINFGFLTVRLSVCMVYTKLLVIFLWSDSLNLSEINNSTNEGNIGCLSLSVNCDRLFWQHLIDHAAQSISHIQHFPFQLTSQYFS